MRARLWIVALSTSWTILACNQSASTGKEDAPAEEAKADAVAEEAGDEQCRAYGNALCDAGNENTCLAAGEITAIMAPQACEVGLANMGYTEERIKERGEICGELAARLCKDVGEDSKACAVVKEQLPEVPPAQCAKMTQEYAQVLSEVQAMAAKDAPLDAQAQQSLLAGSPPSFGPADAKVTIVEFSDFQCPYCSRAADAVAQVKEAYADRARFVFRHFPLSFHQQAHLTAQASMAAHAQGKFWAFHDLAFQNQGDLDRASLEGYAKQAGLDLAAFNTALDDKTHASVVDADLELGKKVHVDGTPTMFVNGERVPNPTDFKSIAEVVDRALAAAG